MSFYSHLLFTIHRPRSRLVNAFVATMRHCRDRKRWTKSSASRSAQKQGDDGAPVAEICRLAGISQTTYFNWKKKYSGLLPTEMRRLKQLEEEGSVRSRAKWARIGGSAWPPVGC
jgi:hypothetical protein